MRKLAWTVAALLPLTACPSGSKPDVEAPAPALPAASCADAAQGAGRAQIAPTDERIDTEELDAARVDLVDALTPACTTDQWSAAVIGCLAAAAEFEAIAPCTDQMTADQRAHFTQIVDGVVERFAVYSD